MIRLKEKLQDLRFLFWIYIIVVTLVAIHRSALDWNLDFAYGSPEFINASHINNFRIFRASFYHLIHHQNLYGFFPSEYFDEFLYSPVFALLIAPLAIFPIYVGVVIWCLLNALLLFYAISLLKIDTSKKSFILLFGLLEMVTSIQNVQANTLIAALFILTFVAFENKRTGLAALLIIISISVKVFGIVGASLFLLYPNKIKFVVYGMFWAVVVFAAPFLVVSLNELIVLYQNWFSTLLSDHANNQVDISAMRMIEKVSHLFFTETTRLGIQLIAVLLFCMKYVRYRSFENVNFRLLFLTTIMIWSTIFNHAAESNSYVIAVFGIAIWYVMQEKNKINLALIVLVYLLTVLSPTDLFPRFVRQNYIVPFALKSLPCFIIWLKIESELLFSKTFITTISSH
jgi:Glycosyltransferase family 87